jgi:hypothetical protein
MLISVDRVPSSNPQPPEKALKKLDPGLRQNITIAINSIENLGV